MSDEDFPAAHSMDTEWYAVDCEGNVGHFDTWEAGAAPTSARAHHDGSPAVIDILRALPPDSGIEYDVEDLMAMPGGPVLDFRGPDRYVPSLTFSDVTSCYSVLLWLADESLLGTHVQGAPSPARRGLWQRLLSRAPQPNASEPVTVERLPNSKYLLGYIEGPVLVSALQQWIEDRLVQKAWVNHSLSATRIGIFEYDHGDAFENWIAGPYLRGQVPRQPLKIDQLPAEFRIYVESTRLPGDRFYAMQL